MMMSPKVIKYYLGWGSAFAVEYLLPCNQMPKKIRSSLSPWLQQIVGLTEQKVQEIVDTRWSSIRGNLLKELRIIAQEYQPKSIVVSEDKSWLVLEKPFVNGLPDRYPENYSENLLLVPAPMSEKT